MSNNKTFHLPDLGEGLPDATIVEWLVKEGESVKLDAPLVSMETAKAVVEVPSPYTGKVTKLHGKAGDVIDTGAALAEFELDPNAKQRAENAAGGHHAPAPAAPKHAPAPAKTAEREDEGTVVGAMVSGNQVVVEQAASVGGVRAVPAVRAMAKKLGVDLARVAPTGADGVVTMQDVKNAAADGTAKPSAAAPTAARAQPAPAPVAARTPLSASGQPMRTAPPSAQQVYGQPDQIKGVRRNMARVMADAHAQVVPTTIVDDADLHEWIGKQDITARLIRAIVFACKTVPALGLFVPALRNADVMDAAGIRAAIKRLRAQTEDRSIPASELSGYTISLSNFGMFAGRYASPVVVPPCVAIVGAGKLSHDVVAVIGAIEVHRRMPISLTFDHRACTGGEAARFLKVLLDDLALPR